MNKSKANVNQILRPTKKKSKLNRIDLPVDRGNIDSINNVTIDTTISNSPGSLTSGDNLYTNPTQTNNSNNLGSIDSKPTINPPEALGVIDTTIQQTTPDELVNINGEIPTKEAFELPNIYKEVTTNNRLGNENINGDVVNSTPPTPLPNVND